jgi:outer membrane protein assembly factor BamD (BamD/ComL family)
MRSSPRLGARILPIWLPLLLLACKGVVPNDPPDELLVRGKQFMKDENYKYAANHFLAIKSRYPESQEDEEASYLLGEAKLRQRYGGASFKALQDFATRYPNSRYAVAAAEAEYKLGIAYFDKSLWGILIFKPDPVVGARVMEHMQVHYRNHALADDALMQAGDFFVKKKRWQAALTFYRRLLQEYPRSSHVLRARFQHARALWNMSEGPDYDERLLLDAHRGFRDFVAAVESEGKQEELASQIESSQKMIAEIDARMAWKYYRVGRFYERTKRPGSALYYYNYCLTVYPDSKHAKKCAKRAEVLTKRGVVERPGLEEPQKPA